MKENQKYILQINSLNNKTQELFEKIAVLEEQIKNNEFLLKGQKSKDNIIQQLNNEIEQYKIENKKIVNEYNN